MKRSNISSMKYSKVTFFNQNRRLAKNKICMECSVGSYYYIDIPYRHLNCRIFTLKKTSIIIHGFTLPDKAFLKTKLGFFKQKFSSIHVKINLNDRFMVMQI